VWFTGLFGFSEITSTSRTILLMQSNSSRDFLGKPFASNPMIQTWNDRGPDGMTLSGSYRILSSPVFPAIAFHRSFPACPIPMNIINDEYRKKRKTVPFFFMEEYPTMMFNAVSLDLPGLFGQCTATSQ
jgi:hypothetical protein